MLFCTSILAVSALVASSGPWPVVPIRWNLGPIAQRIAHEDCRLTLVGDSNSVREAGPRMLGGIMRTWRPDRWVGRVAPAFSSSNEGVQTFSSGTGALHTARRVFDFSNNDPAVWSNGQDGFVPTWGWDIVTDGSGMSASDTYTYATLTRMDEYVDGDWTSGHPMRARLVFVRDPSGLSQLRYRGRRGDVMGEFAILSPEDPQADRAWIDWVEVDIPAGSGEVGGQVRTAPEWLHESEGGPWPCPDNCEAGRTFYHITQVLYRTDAPGLQIDAIAEGGFKAVDHLAEGNQYDDEALRRYLAATREPNVFLILLGQNMNAEEENDIEGLWRSRMDGVLDRYRAATLVNDPDADPLFLLVTPWHADDTTDRYVRIATTLHQIAMGRADCGFINLLALAGSYEHNRSVYLQSQGVHFLDEAGADHFNALLWNQIERELAGHQDLVMPGDIDDMAGMTLDDRVAVHILPGTYVGGVTSSGKDVLIRGWDASSSTLVPPVSGGSAIRVAAGSTLQVERLDVAGGAGEIDAFGQARGGAVAISNGALWMSSSVLHGGSTDLGGVVSSEDGMLQLNDVQIHSGHATLKGGLIHAETSTVHIEDVTLEGGTSAAGGGLSMQGGVLTMARVRVTDCQSDEQGGGLYLEDVEAAVSSMTVLACDANFGGGMWADGGGVLVAASRFGQNSAETIGGGIESIGEAVALFSTDVCGNSPDQVAGTFVDLGENVIQTECPCPTDFNGDGEVGVTDLLVVVSSWGPCEIGCDGDANEDAVVNANDLLMVISAWGVCL